MERNEPVGKAYVTVLSWPQGLQGQSLLELLKQCDLDAHVCNQLLRRQPPFVFGRASPRFMESTFGELVKRGVKLAVFADEQFDQMPAPVLAKSLHPAAGAPKPMYEVEPWRGATFPFLMDEVVLIVRAAVESRTTKTEIQPGTQFSGARGYTGVLGQVAAEEIYGARSGSVVNSSRSAATELLDMYRLDGSRIRIASNKFNFGILGAERASTGRANMDLLVYRLGKEAINAQIDLEFQSFHPPVGLKETRTVADVGNVTVKKTDETGAFDFYSVWRYFLMRIEAGLEP